MAQVAEVLGLSRATVYGLVHRGELPAVRVSTAAWRVRAADLEAWIARRGPGAGG